MEGDITKFSSNELEERINDLEHTYVELFGEEAHTSELHHIHKRILELQRELHKRRDR
jgi:hypothetical protein